MPEGREVVRTCIGCRRRKNQESFVRLTVHDGRVVVTRGKRRAGRGAYVCPSVECVRAAFKGSRLARALRRSIEPDSLREVQEELECQLR